MRTIQIPFFKIWYSSAFIGAFLITFVLTLISPADLIYQAARPRNIANISSIAAVYFAAALFCFFIWASRIYTNRAVLRDIPKHYLPIEAGEVPRKIRRLIEKQWKRSALIAWDSRPRDVSIEVRVEEAAAALAALAGNGEEEGLDGSARRHDRRFLRSKRVNETTLLRADVALKAWGRISHPGWSPPDAATGRDESVPYATVIVELPHLLEAKAVSLAPPEVCGSQLDDSMDRDESSTPDPRVVALLQRPPRMGLRDYVNYLLDLSVIPSLNDAETFLEQYEYARFSTRAMTEDQFASLTATFSTILSTMTFDLERVTPMLATSELGSVSSLSVSTVSHLARNVDHSTLDAESIMYPESDEGSIRHHPPRSSSGSQTAESISSVIINPSTE